VGLPLSYDTMYIRHEIIFVAKKLPVNENSNLLHPYKKQIILEIIKPIVKSKHFLDFLKHFKFKDQVAYKNTSELDH